MWFHLPQAGVRQTPLGSCPRSAEAPNGQGALISRLLSLSSCFADTPAAFVTTKPSLQMSPRMKRTLLDIGRNFLFSIALRAHTDRNPFATAHDFEHRLLLHSSPRDREPRSRIVESLLSPGGFSQNPTKLIREYSPTRGCTAWSQFRSGRTDRP